MLLKTIGTCYRYWYVWLTVEKCFIALEAEVDKLDINKLTNVPTSLNDLKTKVDDLDVAKLKVAPVD